MQAFEQLELESTSISSRSPQTKLYEEVTVSNKKIYNCLIPGCGKTFKFKSEMKRHLTIHSNDRPYVCTFPECGKTFKRADALSNHFRIHSRSTPFNCPVPECMSQFTTKSALRYHLLKHTGDKIFKCNYPGCNKAFITYAQLKQHEKASYYHQKVTDTPFLEDSLQKENSILSLDGLDDIRLPDEDEHHDCDCEGCEHSHPKLEEFERKFEEISNHKDNFAEKLKAFRSYDTINGKFREKHELSSPDSSDLSSVSKSEKKVESTLMKMLDFMMKENQELKKKLKYTADLLQNSTIRELQSKDDFNVDFFFKSQAQVQAQAQEQDDEWGERKFGFF